MGNSFRFSQGLQTRWGLAPCETLKRCILLMALALTFQFSSLAAEDGSAKQRLKFNPLPELPDAIGVAGPVVGVDQDRLIVAGGANFARPDGSLKAIRDGSSPPLRKRPICSSSVDGAGPG